MPHPPDQKARTRSRIIAAASRLFRERGYGKTSVDELMGEAGLTRGGFYAHFANKAALFEAALEVAFAASDENLLSRGLDELRGDDWLRRASERYLSAAHVAGAERGCPVPALGAEVARAEPSVRRAFDAQLDRLLSRLAERLGGEPAQARVRAIRRLAMWTGALTMARAATRPALREEIVESCRLELAGSSDGE